MKKNYFLLLVMVLSTIVSAVPYYGWMEAETVTAGTVGLWQWNASSGNAANSVSGGLSLNRTGNMGYTAGKFGNGALSPGGVASTDYWQIGYDNGNGRNMDAIGPDSSLSAAVWIRPDVLPTGASARQVIFDKAYSNTPSAGYELYLWYDSISSNIYVKAAIGTTAGTSVLQNSVISLVSGEWTHLALVWDADQDTLKIYQDGEVLGSTVSAGSVYAPSVTGSTNPQLLRVGNRIGSSYGTFNGAIDDLKINDIAIQYAVPEPATIALITFGLALIRKRK